MSGRKRGRQGRSWAGGPQMWTLSSQGNVQGHAQQHRHPRAAGLTPTPPKQPTPWRPPLPDPNPAKPQPGSEPVSSCPTSSLGSPSPAPTIAPLRQVQPSHVPAQRPGGLSAIRRLQFKPCRSSAQPLTLRTSPYSVLCSAAGPGLLAPLPPPHAYGQPLTVSEWDPAPACSAPFQRQPRTTPDSGPRASATLPAPLTLSLQPLGLPTSSKSPCASSRKPS